MSYDKQPKSAIDAPLGFRRVNALVDNQDDTRALLETEHVPQPEFLQLPQHGPIAGRGTRYVATAGLPEVEGGQHDTPKVARGELTISFSSLFAVGSYQPKADVLTGVVAGIVRLGVGVYFVPVSGLSSFDAQVFPIYDAEDSFGRAVQQAVSQAEGATGIYITTWREASLGSGSTGFELYDMNFHGVVFGFREEPAVTAAPFAVARRRPLAPKPFTRGPFKRHPVRR